MNWFPHIVCAVVGLLVTVATIPKLLRRGTPSKLDGNGVGFHHTHKAPVPRLGGVALASSFVVISLMVFLWFPVEWERTQTRLVVFSTSLLMFGLGLWDDLWPLGARKKLIGQILISALVCLLGVRIEMLQNPLTGQVYELGFLSWGVTIFWLVALTNMINLIDGIDGLAGGISLMLMGLLVFVGWRNGLAYPILAAAGMIGALLGFLRYNFPPAKIYMGDGGAYFLGFLIALLTLIHSQKGTIATALIAPLFALALPILDVGIAIMRRGLRGLPLFRADRHHLHHRLQRLGLSRERTLWMLYGVSVVCLLMAFGVFWSQGRWVPILFGFLCLTLVFLAQAFSFSRQWFAVGEILEQSLEVRKETAYALALSKWLELEAERANTLDDLWTDYVFAVQKLGLRSVKLTGADTMRAWESTVPVMNRLACTHDLPLGGSARLDFSGDGDVMSERVFDHLSELAAEAWVKATTRWRANRNRSERTAQSTQTAATTSPQNPPLTPVTNHLVQGEFKHGLATEKVQ